MSYQAVIRDSENQLVVNSEIGMRISILQGSTSGAAVYTETRAPATNINGLVTFEIGGEGANAVTGVFSAIDWSAGPYFVKTETDPSGGTNYTITGTSQLLSVPYALHSGSSDVLTGEITEGQSIDLQTYYLASNPDGFITAYIVTEEDVTAHESALSISESQITDLQNYLTSITGKSIGDLADIDLTGIAAGKVLKYDDSGGKWVIDDDLGLTEETDPVFEASPAAGIETADIANWNEAYSRGDHDGLYRTNNWTPGWSDMPEGTATGEMRYWDGNEWREVTPGNEGQVLAFVNGVPAWSTPPLGLNDVISLTGKIWMDRNLGAARVAQSSTDAEAYGDLYQWGRDTDGHQIRTSETTSTLSNSDTPGHGNFITVGVSPMDWRSPQNDNLWQGVNGINNPCPPGYRLPTEAEWDAELESWSSPDAVGAFASPLKLPMAGYRFRSTASLQNIGNNGWYRSSTVVGSGSSILNFTSGHAYTQNSARADGMSVRCIKD